MRSLAVIAILCGSAATAAAHKPSDSHLRLDVEGQRIGGRLDVAVRDLDAALGIDDGDGSITWRELEAHAPRIAAYVTERLALADGGAPCPITLGVPALLDLSDGTYWAQPLHARCIGEPRSLTLTYGLLFDVDAQHRGLVHVGGNVLLAHDRTPIAIGPGSTSSTLEFVREGVRHIWLGFDHLVFLICLLLPAVFPRRLDAEPVDSLRDVTLDVLRVVTAFTLAHSITLAISTFGLVRLPSRFVETAIALSIVVAAVNNLVRVIDARWFVAFALGLLHGFGFSSVLLDLGLPSHGLAAPLLGFNLGVELGQLAIVAVVLPVLYVVRRTLAYRALLWAGSAAAAAVGLFWTYERLFT